MRLALCFNFSNTYYVLYVTAKNNITAEGAVSLHHIFGLKFASRM